jgi:MFS family permease
LQGHKGLKMENQTISKLTKTIFFSQSIQSAAQVTMMTILSISAFKISGQESLSSLPHSLLTFSPALTAFSMRLVMNHFGWRLGLSLGYFFGALGAFLGLSAVLNNTYWLLILAAFFLGTARASADLSRYAVGQMFESSKRARMIGRVVFASAIGGILGPLLSPWAGDFAPNLSIPADAGIWGLSAILYLAAAVFTILFLYPDPNKFAKSALETEEKITTKASVWRSFKLPVVQLAVSSMAISQLVMVVLMVMTPLHIHKLHYGNEVVAYVISAHVLGMFGLAAVTGYLIDRFGTIPMLFTGALVLASSAILAPLTSSGLVLAIALFLLGLGWNFSYVAGSSLLSSSLSHAQKSKLQGISDSLIAGIAGLSSLGSGPVFAMSGYLGLSIAGLLITIFLMVLIYFLSLQIERKEVYE